MRDLNKINRFFFLVLICHLALVLTSCVPSSSNNRSSKNTTQSSTSSSDSSNDTVNDPSFSNSLNYFQNGTIKTNSYLTLESDFNNHIYLRGSEVDNFIKNGNTTDVQCLIVHYPASTSNDFLAVAASPQSFINFSTNTREYYYLLQPSQESTNKAFCQTTGIISMVGAIDALATISYDLDSVCPSCTTTLDSNFVTLYTDAGGTISNINISYLSLKLSNYFAPETPVGNSCTTSSTCISLGYDCCSLGQCVTDGQLKDGVDTSSAEYLQAQADITSNPANIVNYQEFYHICGTEIITEPTPTEPPPPEIDATDRFKIMKRLYECTSLQYAEMSYCTVIFKDASTATTSFTTGADDRTFSNTYSGTAGLSSTHSIVEVIHAGETLTEGVDYTVSGANDTLTDTTTVTLTHTKKDSAPDDDLIIKYQIDGSCVEINSTLAQCTKYYTQGQNTGKIDDHYPASNSFKIPYYADVTKAIKVEVDGVAKLSDIYWTLDDASTPAEIDFNGASLAVYDTQVVKIIFYVDMTGGANPVFQEKADALDDIDTYCECGGPYCTLEEKKEFLSGVETVTDYTCVYPQPDTPEAPLQQTVLLSSKTVPVRYFDSTGVPHEAVEPGSSQEGTAFSYTDDNLLKPNNVSSYIGFNEIYGSITDSPTGAQPAKEVDVTDGKTYDIFVDYGTFSTCYYCGTDYYTHIAKLFPENFLYKGGGYIPDDTATNRSLSTNTYRADDLIFGRACFVPATMIPWTHKSMSDRQQQRLKRLQSQHFLFANGYQRDWYGFDYGSVIGSFNGVHWFSVGNQRRIKATSNKLYLAVNAFFGDLTSESTFQIVVSDASSTPSSGSTIASDFQSDGAQCQQYHLCTNDQDCVAQLGWEYTCQSVSNIKTKWPTFDKNGYEIPGVEDETRLISLVGNYAGTSKRCVYRGKGAPCDVDYTISDVTTSYNGTDIIGLHVCNSNYYCQEFSSGGGYLSLFNNRIARYGKSIQYQNASSDVSYSDADTFGLGTRIIGRPYDYNGSEQIDSDVVTNLTNNNIASICIPGRNPSNATISNSHKTSPTANDMGDQVLGIGMTQSGNSASSSYLSSCAILDDDGNYYHLDSANVNNNLNATDLYYFAGGQVLSTNALSIFESETETIIRNFDSEQITQLTLQQNRCLRAPGSVCHTDLDCGPSEYVTSKTAAVNAESNSLNLNKYETRFWQETLVCSQAEDKDSSNYDIANNRCCREVGNNITIPTYLSSNSSDTYLNFDKNAIPAIDTDLDSSTRYSRWSSIYWEMKHTIDGTGGLDKNYPILEAAENDQCSSGSGCMDSDDLQEQFNTLSTVAERTCCSGHWIRNFASTNGGGYQWDSSKAQNVDKEEFSCYNWLVAQNSNQTGDSNGAKGYTCSHTSTPLDPDCLIRTVSTSQADTIFEWINTLELTGIPQIKIKTDDFTDIHCNVSTTSQTATVPYPMGGLIKWLSAETAEYQDSSNLKYYSAIDTDSTSGNFESGVKEVFSSDTFTCCLPAGKAVNEDTDESECCTGFINNQTGRCALKDYANVTVYFNRYVSSAGKNLSDTLYDKDTGYLKDPSIVESLACLENVCASGMLARGVALSNLLVPGHETETDIKTKRFIDSNQMANNFNGLADLYDFGLRWNNNVYCVPSTISSSSEDIQVLDCSSL